MAVALCRSVHVDMQRRVRPVGVTATWNFQSARTCTPQQLRTRVGLVSELHTNGTISWQPDSNASAPVPMLPASLLQLAPGIQGTSVPASVTVAVQEVVPDLLPPAQAYMAQAKDGAKKITAPMSRTFVMGLYAAAYIALGATLSMSITNACPGLYASNPGLSKLLFALLFPVGLTLNTLHGTELFTGNTLKMTAAVLEGKATLKDLARNWTVSYLGNLVGSIAFVGAVLATGLMSHAQLPVDLAVAKTSLSWGAAFSRAVLANWLVCMAVFAAGAASSLPGKLAAIWPPIAAFVAMGLEHSIANMFIIPLGMALGAPVSAGAFFCANLVPVTLGNIVGGALFVGMASSSFYGALAGGSSSSGSAVPTLAGVR